ncbi:MAG: FdhF/YdeP family oxidoreductase [Oceanospirillaceae bacterium]
MSKEKISPYRGSAGGWGALASTSKYLLKSRNPVNNIRSLLKTNQHSGFDCPGCAWGDQKSGHKVSFCENGAKAVNWEATAKKVSRAFFAENSVSHLDTQSDYFLEYQGRLTEPMRYNRATDHYEPVSWDDAFQLIAEKLNALDNPNQAEFYTSGRASNEAAFLYQLFVRSFGTNNFPDCSNMCHEASAIAMNDSIGVGKGTVTMDDFSLADAIFVFGQNPGTNHPRMLDTLRQATKRGATVVSFNNLRERGLERFTNPQEPLEMLSNGHTEISKYYYCPKLGGDMALVRGVVKALLEIDEQALQNGSESIFDWLFINDHCVDIQAYLELVNVSDWSELEQYSGITREDMQQIAQIYASSERVICSWAMGLTQHTHSVAIIQEIINLLLLRGNVGKPGAGACPVRGHSNVQGDRTMGINEKAPAALMDALEKEFSIKIPRERGHNAVQAVEAMRRGASKVFIALGGNFAAAMSDTTVTRAAMAQCDLVVNISTKLNRSHITPGKDALILPCLGRTEVDVTQAGEQRITVEDSMCMVHSSAGVLPPSSKQLKSEVQIIASIAHHTLDKKPIDWLEVAKDNSKIRDHISRCVPGFSDFNHKIEQPGGFYLQNTAGQRIWNTPNKKANFSVKPLASNEIDPVLQAQTQTQVFTLQSLRSHDQYNTTVYGYNDRYRGIKGLRNVLFINPLDIEQLGFIAEQKVDIHSHWHDKKERNVCGFILVPYDIPRGNLAAYYPETNPLVPLNSYGERSFTPTSKAISVSLVVHKGASLELKNL